MFVQLRHDVFTLTFVPDEWLYPWLNCIYMWKPSSKFHKYSELWSPSQQEEAFLFQCKYLRECVLNDRKGTAISYQGTHYVSGHTCFFDVQIKCPHWKSGERWPCLNRARRLCTSHRCEQWWPPLGTNGPRGLTMPNGEQRRRGRCEYKCSPAKSGNSQIPAEGHSGSIITDQLHGCSFSTASLRINQQRLRRISYDSLVYYERFMRQPLQTKLKSSLMWALSSLQGLWTRLGSNCGLRSPFCSESGVCEHAQWAELLQYSAWVLGLSSPIVIL